MFHQNGNNFDFGTTLAPQPKDFHYLVASNASRDLQRMYMSSACLINYQPSPEKNWSGLELKLSPDLERPWSALKTDIYPSQVSKAVYP